MANPGTTCIVSGDIETPGSASATGGQVEFHLSSWDTDGTQTITDEPQIVQVSADGTISVPLWRNARGEVGLLPGDLTRASEWREWVAAMQAECRRAIQAGDDPMWPDLPEGVAEMAARF